MISFATGVLLAQLAEPGDGVGAVPVERPARLSGTLSSCERSMPPFLATRAMSRRRTWPVRYVVTRDNGWLLLIGWMVRDKGYARHGPTGTGHDGTRVESGSHRGRAQSGSSCRIRW